MTFKLEFLLMFLLFVFIPLISGGSGSGSVAKAPVDYSIYDKTLYPMGPPGPAYLPNQTDFTGLIMNISWAYSPNRNSGGFNVIVTRPTDSSVTISVISLLPGWTAVTIDYWPTAMKLFTHSTQTQALPQYVPVSFDISGLAFNTNHTYQIHYQSGNTQIYIQSYTFRTARPPGDSFSFAIEADPHHDLDHNYPMMNATYSNIVKQKPDFMLSLGDYLMSDKLQYVNRSNIELRAILCRQWWDLVNREVPLFITHGNHEYETIKNLYNITNMSVEIRKQYFPGPVPNSFFSGSDTQTYYAFNWGDALLVILDPFLNTMAFSGWSYSLGYAQYTWMRTTLENSKAKYKFVFSHNLVGGNTGARGGIEYAKYYEWGGYYPNGTYAFDWMRPGWGKPIHQVFVDTGVRAWIHGHDHLYVSQKLDGIVYLETPQPGHLNVPVASATLVANSPGYGYLNGTIMAYSGHLLVTVTPQNATINYVDALGNFVRDSIVINA